MAEKSSVGQPSGPTVAGTSVEVLRVAELKPRDCLIMSTKALDSDQSLTESRFAPTGMIGVMATFWSVPAAAPAAAKPASTVCPSASVAVPTSVQVPSAPVGDV